MFQIRNENPALQSGELIWINNSEPDKVLSFVRRNATDEVIVFVNLSNRNTHVTVDLPVMEYSSVENLFTGGKTSFQLYSGRVSMDLSAYEAMAGKRIPLAQLQSDGRKAE